MAVQSQLVYEFGRFRLIPSEHELLRDDQPLPLPPKVFDTLLALVENGGHLKEKEELIRQLWPDSFVDDASLARNISQLRKVLGTREDGGEFIETIPKRGYRFIAPVTQVKADEYLPAAAAPSLTPASAPAAEPFGSASRHNVSNRRRLPRGRLLLIGAALICIFAAATVWWTRAAARPPHVTRLQQITTSGRVEPWGRIVTDGSRIYFLERYADHWRAMQAPAAGGPTQPVQWSIPGKNFRVLDASPDGSQFLAGSFDESDEEMPLWIEPAVGGPPVRVGNVMAYDASWVPDGQHIIYSHDRAVFLVGNSGDHQVRVAEVPGIAGWFSWSRDGKRVRFSLRDPITYRPSLWEVAVDGSGFHPVLPLSSGEADWMGQWSADARFFVFTSTRGGRQNLWAIKEGHEASPLQLTAGPNGYVGGIFSRDGKTIFAPVVDSKADVVRYDPETRRFFPFFTSAKTNEMSFSRDGNWMVYNGGALTRSRIDGSERLVFPTGAAPGHGARVSPDGSEIALTDSRPDGTLGISIASMAAGTLRPVFNKQLSRPDWSPDGKKIVCDSLAPIPPSTQTALYIGDPASETLTMVPGSQGLQAPRWSPDGRYLAALEWPSSGQRKIMLFDFRFGRWKQLAKALYPTIPEWSHDGRDLYFQDLLSDGQPIMRIAVATGKTERVVAFGSDYGNSFVRAAFLALGPGDRPIIDVTRNIADIYALDVDLP